MHFLATGRERPARSMISLLVLFLMNGHLNGFFFDEWAFASPQGTSPPHASTDRAYLFDFWTCPECTHGLNQTTAWRCVDPEDPSVSHVFFVFNC